MPNKARRNELKKLKYKKRLEQLGLKEGPKNNYHAYRSHGSPCSCYMCKDKKYREGDRQKFKKEDYGNDWDFGEETDW